jgi:AcrR family transcriptional regulator
MNKEWQDQIIHHRNKRREGIIQSAQQLFLERGLSAVTLNDIVKTCGISKVTLYKYFRSLDEIIFEVQMNVLSELGAEIISTPLHGNNGWEKLDHLLHLMIEYTERKPENMRFIAFFDFNYYDQYPTPELEKEYIRFLRSSKSIYITLLEEGIQDGSIRNDLEIKLLNFTISNIVSATLQRMTVRGKVLQLDQGIEPRLILKQMVNMVMTYLKP